MRGWERKGVIKKLLLLKEKPNKLIEDWSVKIDTLFMTKMAAKWLKSIPSL